jgi:hypothetical protein
MKTVKFLWAGMLALAAAGLGLSGAPARADVITFDVSGTMTPTLNAACFPTCTLGGDIVFDNSAGAPHMGISADVTVTGFSPSTGPFTGFAGIAAVSGLTRLTIDDASGDFVDLFFSTPTAGSLVGYTGGVLFEGRDNREEQRMVIAINQRMAVNHLNQHPQTLL